MFSELYCTVIDFGFVPSYCNVNVWCVNCSTCKCIVEQHILRRDSGGAAIPNPHPLPSPPPKLRVSVNWQHRRTACVPTHRRARKKFGGRGLLDAKKLGVGSDHPVTAKRDFGGKVAQPPPPLLNSKKSRFREERPPNPPPPCVRLCPYVSPPSRPLTPGIRLCVRGACCYQISAFCICNILS